MAPESLMDVDANVDEEEEYASADDSDFAPDNVPALESDSSEAEDAKIESRTKKPRIDDAEQAEDVGYDNSGDEAIIGKKGGAHKRSKRTYHEDDGEGGLIKTRRQRAAEVHEKRYEANKGPVTIDVDTMWAQMIAGAMVNQKSKTTEQIVELDEETDGISIAQGQQPTAPREEEEDTMIRIKRTYKFAGQVHVEEKVVHRDSAEAKLFLASGGEPVPDDATSSPKRKTRKAFRSAFEPVTDLVRRRGDLNLGLTALQQAGKEAQAKKLNAVEKSRMDWAGYVDEEGIKDELELAGKSKESYAARQDFLARSEAIRDEEARRARLLGKT